MISNIELIIDDGIYNWSNYTDITYNDSPIMINIIYLIIDDIDEKILFRYYGKAAGNIIGWASSS